MSQDVTQVLTRYAPSAASLAAEWDDARMRATLTDIIGTADDIAPRLGSHAVPLRFVPATTVRGHRRHAALTSVASVAVLAALVGIVVAVLRNSGGQQQVGGSGPVFDPPAGLSGAALGARQYAYRQAEQMDLGPDGKPKQNGPDAMVDRSWVAANGDIVSLRTGTQQGCFVFTHGAKAYFSEPTAALFASMPTDVSTLYTYLRSHVSGSSTRDQAMFVAIGDMLRTGDSLASPRLRGALVAVLSRTPGVTVHTGERDYLGRAAIRADFVDQRIEPGVVESMFFDPTSFRLLEERTGSNGQPTRYTGPSPAYDAAPTGPATAPGPLEGTAYLNVITGERVVGKLPKLPSNCH